jgi:hypothetical protein
VTLKADVWQQKQFEGKVGLKYNLRRE